MGYKDITRESVLSAIAEFDQKGKVVILTEYGYQDARAYFLLYNGKEYPSKAIVGIAHKHAFPGKGPLKSSEFSGGKETVQKVLERLGFRLRIK